MDYFESISTSASQYEKKKSDLEQISREIAEFGEATKRYTKEKYGLPITVSHQRVKDNFFDIAGKKHDSLISALTSFTDYLSLVAENGDTRHFQRFSISLGGFPIVAKDGENETVITSIPALKRHLASIAGDFKFFYIIEDMVNKAASERYSDEDNGEKD